MARVLVLIVMLTACETTENFVCARDEHCRMNNRITGICEPDGICSFGDPACPSGRRFDEIGGSNVAGSCVGGGTTSCVFGLAIGDAAMCARLTGGRLSCWGRNTDLQLTDGLVSPQTQPAQVSAFGDVAQVQIGERHTCIRGDGDVLRCVGKNDYGQLGNDATANTGRPVDAVGLGSVRDFDVHGEHTCAVASADGAVRCWGRNLEGQLGDGSRTDNRTPVHVTIETGDALIGATSITAGRRHACALVAGGVHCWGANLHGEIGDGTVIDRQRAVEVPGLGDVVELEAGREHTCARDSDGRVWCWGKNVEKQTASGPDPQMLAPTLVALPGPARSVALGHNHSCALIGTNAWCWGKNAEGQIADPSPTVATPTRLAGFPPAAMLAAGFNNTCVIDAGGSVWCRGSNSEGQLANGTTGPDPVSTPVALPVTCP